MVKSKVQLPGPGFQPLDSHFSACILDPGRGPVLFRGFIRTLDLELSAGTIFPFLGGPELPPRQAPELCLDQMSVLRESSACSIFIREVHTVFWVFGLSPGEFPTCLNMDSGYGSWHWPHRLRSIKGLSQKGTSLGGTVAFDLRF